MNVTCSRILLAEDEPILRVSLSEALRKEGWTVDAAEDGQRALALFEEHLHGIVLTDLVMPRLDGLELLQRVKKLSPGTTVLVMTAFASIESAVETMREGAADFIVKPFTISQLFARLGAVCTFRQLQEQNRQLQAQLETRYSFAKMIGKSKEMRDVFELIQLVADSDANVLVQGESGTGKEMVAAAIHYNSRRRGRPYIRVACASLPETLLESELFGYERGAFTGATERHLGRFEAAHRGTLFLDEIGELPPSFQVKLLRVLQERQIERLGSHKSVDVDVRLVSATLRPLDRMLAEGRLREDLYFRVNTVVIQIPPLRDRREDIPLLAAAFLSDLAQEQGKPGASFDDAVLELFDAYAWPGNVRELRNVVERALLLSRDGRIAVDALPPALRVRGNGRKGAGDEVVTLHVAIERAEVEAIRAALAATSGRRAEAAELLGVSRKTLWERCKHLGLGGDD
jgi:DNA-binding NtrC family response regulator